jgi:hypothetical protein
MRHGHEQVDACYRKAPCEADVRQLVCPERRRLHTALGLNADVVAWIVSVMQSGGEMQGIENITSLTKALTLRHQAAVPHRT